MRILFGELRSVSDIALYFWEMLSKHVKFEDKEVQRSLEPLVRAYTSLSVYLNKNHEETIETLKELDSLSKIILKMLSVTSNIDLCEGIEETDDSLERDLIMVDIRNLHSSLTSSWDTTIRTVQASTLELAAFFISAGVGSRLLPTYLPYVFLSLMFFVAITYFFFSFRLILSEFFDLRRDVLACKLGEMRFLKNTYSDFSLAPSFVPIFFTFPFQKRFERDVAIFNDSIMLGLLLAIIFFSLFEASIFYFYVHVYVNYPFTLIFSVLFFFLITFSFRFIPKLHYKYFGIPQKNFASRKYRHIYNLRREK